MNAKIFLSALMVSGFVATANAADVAPTNFCEGQPCTPQMQEVADLYAAASASPQLSPVDPWLASGDCWHIQRGLDPNVTHHSMFLFEHTIRGLWARGLFSFFTATNPYAGMDVNEARKFLNARYTNGGKVYEDHGDHAEWSYDAEHSKITYWVRVNPSTGETYLLSRWNFWGGQNTDHRIFCKMQKH